MKKKYLFLIGISIVLIFLAFYLFVYNNNLIPNKIIGSESNYDGCNDIFLGVCFDKGSIFYQSNMDTQQSNQEDFKIVSMIKLMKEKNITIVMSSTCPVCKQQLFEFGDFQEYLTINGLVIFCDLYYQIQCLDVRVVPTWKENNKIAYEGIISSENFIQIINDFI